MSGLKMPPKGKGAAMLQELNAEHAPKEPAEPLETLKGTNAGSLQATNVTKLQTSTERASRPRRPSKSPIAQPPIAHEPEIEPRPTPAMEREERLLHATQRAREDDIAVVTVRVSARLNQYMDEYVARLNLLDPKRRYRKQDAIAEAFAAFYADHPLPPLPEEDDL